MGVSCMPPKQERRSIEREKFKLPGTWEPYLEWHDRNACSSDQYIWQCACKHTYIKVLFPWLLYLLMKCFLCLVTLSQHYNKFFQYKICLVFYSCLWFITASQISSFTLYILTLIFLIVVIHSYFYKTLKSQVIQILLFMYSCLSCQRVITYLLQHKSVRQGHSLHC